jgi:hypothetical protein
MNRNELIQFLNGAIDVARNSTGAPRSIHECGRRNSSSKTIVYLPLQSGVRIISAEQIASVLKNQCEVTIEKEVAYSRDTIAEQDVVSGSIDGNRFSIVIATSEQKF